MNKNKLINQKNLEQIFEDLDIEGSGYITKSNLKLLLDRLNLPFDDIS